MSFDFESQLADLQSDLDAARSEMAETQKRLKLVSGSATSPDGTLAITLDASGAVDKVEVMGSRHRKMPAKQLAALILETIRAAREEYQASLLEAMPESRFDGVSNEDLVTGSFDLSDLIPDDFAVPEMNFPADFGSRAAGEKARPSQPSGS